MSRRNLLSWLALGGMGALKPSAADTAPAGRSDTLRLSDDEWRKRLTAEQFRVLRREGTEAPFSSQLNGEKRRGTYNCVACDLPLFASSMKFDSGTGWPSFFETLPGALGFRTDYKLLLPRTEYHCARCGGHHGHVFDDGPKPSGKRYCNNGVCLKFEPEIA
jgi:peptide-methionine (R)-S-oxide reductase